MKAKRVAAFFLSLTMVVSMAGFNTLNVKAAEIDMEEDPYTVAIQVVTLPGTTLEQEEEIEEAVNAITLPAINCKVDIQNTWISEVQNTTSMGVAGDEKLDLIHVATVQSLSSLMGSDILYDMNTDDLLQEHGAKLTEMFGDLLKCGEIGGKQLAVPADIWVSKAVGGFYNKDIADKYGLTVPEETDLDGIEKVLYEVKEKVPDVMPYFNGEATILLTQYFYDYEGFGSNAAYGVVMDSSKETKVENLYASDLFKDYCLRMYKWKKDGIMTGDTTDTTTTQAYFKENKLFFNGCEVSPGAKSQNGSNYPDINLGWTTIAPQKITNSTATAYMWGIASNSERPDKAMDFLNFMYSNAEVANLLKYGIEGKNYTFAEGSEKVIQTNGTHMTNFYHGGDSAQMYVAAPAGESYVEDWEAFNAAAELSPLVNYMFDDTDYQTESALITSTITEYLPRLQSGAGNSEEEVLALLDEFNAKLDAAGINDVIAANQEQMDAYLAAQQ